MKRVWAVNAAIALVVCGCAPRELPPEAFRRWVEDPANGLRPRAEAGPLVYEAQYRPLEYVLLQEFGANDSLREARRAAFAGQQYFTLRVSAPEAGAPPLKAAGGGYEAYQARLTYCLQGMREDLYLEEKGRRLPCRLFHFERAYDLAPYATFTLSFSRAPEERAAAETHASYDYPDKTLIFYDNLLGGGKEIKLTLSGDALQNLPRIQRAEQ